MNLERIQYQKILELKDQVKKERDNIISQIISKVKMAYKRDDINVDYTEIMIILNSFKDGQDREENR